MQAQAIDRVDAKADGYIAGIASTPSLDAYGHIVRAGAFDHSIRTKGLTGPRSIKLLLGHDHNKPAGVIRRLYTQNDQLRIEAELALGVSYVRDVYEIIKQNDGLSFSVGFLLEDFDETAKNLIIKRGELLEVSIVTFPACADATMELVKSAPASFARELAALNARHDLVIARARADLAALRGKIVMARMDIERAREKELWAVDWRHQLRDRINRSV